MIMKGVQLCWGIDPRWAILPIVDLPEGVLKVRRKIRSDYAMRIYLKFPDRIEEWISGPTTPPIYGISLVTLIGVNKQKVVDTSPKGCNSVAQVNTTT